MSTTATKKKTNHRHLIGSGTSSALTMMIPSASLTKATIGALSDSSAPVSTMAPSVSFLRRRRMWSFLDCARRYRSARFCEEDPPPWEPPWESRETSSPSPWTVI